MCGVGRGLLLHRTCSFNDQFDVVVVLQTGRRDETGGRGGVAECKDERVSVSERGGGLFVPLHFAVALDWTVLVPAR